VNFPPCPALHHLLTQSQATLSAVCLFVCLSVDLFIRLSVLYMCLVCETILNPIANFFRQLTVFFHDDMRSKVKMKEKYLHGKFFVSTKFFFKKLFFPHFKRSNLWLSTFSHFHMPKLWVLWSVEITIPSQTFMNPIMTEILSACKGVGKAI
jgi:hypothetical protein